MDNGREFEVVVTGTGRSGTSFAAAWLTSAGVPCGHEMFFGPGGIVNTDRWLELKAESSWLAVPWLDTHLVGVPIIHQVRHPRLVLASCLRHPPGTTPQYLAFLKAHCPETREYGDTLNIAAARWVYWNQMIEEKCANRDSYFWVIEEREAGLLEWLQERGIVGDLDDDVLLFSNRRRNTHRPDVQINLRWQDIAGELQQLLQGMMERYGYEWEGT